MGNSHPLGSGLPDSWPRRFVRTTPGVVGMIAVVVVAGCVCAGLVCGAQLDARITKSQAILDGSEPLASAAQELYTALSTADASAATAFLSAGIETDEMRARYQQALADAASALVETTAGTADAETRTALAKIAAQLITYSGLVESAEANNRQKFVVGSSYFREASALMQTSLLPGAKHVYTENLATLDDDQRADGAPPVASFVMLGLALAAIGISSVILVGRTNRQFNLGLVVAAALVVVVIAWIAVATHVATRNIEASRTEDAAKFGRLGNARIVAERARTDEILELVAHTDITSGEASFTGHIDELSALLAPGPSDAAGAVAKWIVAHRKQVETYNGGDYLGAVSQATGTDPDGSAAQFARVEISVRDEIEHARAMLRDRVSTAGERLAWSPTGTLALTVAAAVAAIVGLWPRLREFQ